MADASNELPVWHTSLINLPTIYGENLDKSVSCRRLVCCPYSSLGSTTVWVSRTLYTFTAIS